MGFRPQIWIRLVDTRSVSNQRTSSTFTGPCRTIQGTLIAIGSAKFMRELPAEVTSRWRVRWSIDMSAARRMVIAHADILGFLVEFGLESAFGGGASKGGTTQGGVTQGGTTQGAETTEPGVLHELKRYGPIIGVVPPEQMTPGLEALRDGRCEYVLNSPIRKLDVEHIIARRLRHRAA
jgi:hypothetical protein